MSWRMAVVDSDSGGSLRWTVFPTLFLESIQPTGFQLSENRSMCMWCFVQMAKPNNYGLAAIPPDSDDSVDSRDGSPDARMLAQP